MECLDLVLILLKERHSLKVMTEIIYTRSEDLKSYAFMYNIKSNFDKVKYYCSVIM